MHLRVGRGPPQWKLHFPEHQAEYDAAQLVKRSSKIIVVIGNPPYNRFAGVPLAEEADLVDPHKAIERYGRVRQVGPSEAASVAGGEELSHLGQREKLGMLHGDLHSPAWCPDPSCLLLASSCIGQLWCLTAEPLVCEHEHA